MNTVPSTAQRSGRELKGAVGRRLRTALLALSTITLTIGAIGVYVVVTARDSMRDSIEVVLPIAKHADALSSKLQQFAANSEAVNAAPSIAQLNRWEETLSSQREQISKLIEQLAPTRTIGDSLHAMSTQFADLQSLSAQQVATRGARLELSKRLRLRLNEARAAVAGLGQTMQPLLLTASEQVHERTLDIDDIVDDPHAERRIKELVNELTLIDVPRIERLSDLQRGIDRLSHALDRLPQERNVDSIEGDFVLALRSVTARLSVLDDAASKKQIAQYLSQLYALGIEAGNVFEQRAELLTLEQTLRGLQREIELLSLALSDRVHRIVTQTRDASDAATAHASSMMNLGAFLMLFGLFALAITAIIASRYLLRRIARPLDRVIASLQGLASGQLDIPIPVEKVGDIVQLTHALEVFRSHARTVDQQRALLAERAQALARSEERFALAAEGAAAGIWERPDLNSKTLFWSARLYELLGYDPDDVEASFETLQNLMHPDDQEPHQRALQQHLEHGTPYSVEYRLMTNQRGYRWFHATGLARRDEHGRPTSLAGSISDITERVEAERELRRSNQELEQFAAIASHDLQEPLRMVVSYCELLQRRYSEGDRIDSDAQEFIDFAADGALRMQRLIKSLLEYSRAGSRALDVQPTSLNRVLETALANLAQMIDDTKAVISLPNDPPAVLADEAALSRVFTNLLQNAIKFQDGERPRVDITTALNSSQQVAVTITDNGIGIDEKYRQRVFEVFRRLHPESRFPGSGIGLAVCRRTMERLGGSLELDQHQPEQGTRFVLLIPGVEPAQVTPGMATWQQQTPHPLQEKSTATSNS